MRSLCFGYSVGRLVGKSILCVFFVYFAFLYKKFLPGCIQIAAWRVNDLLNPPLQQVHPRTPLRCSIWVESCPFPVFSCTDRRVSTSCDCHKRHLAAYMCQTRLSSRRLEQSDDSASTVAEQHAGIEIWMCCRMETSAQSRYCSMAAPTFGRGGGGRK